MTEPTVLEPFLPSMEWLLEGPELPFPAMLPFGLRLDLDRAKVVQV